MKRLLTFFFFCSFLLLLIQAQPVHQIKGTVIDKNSRQPLEFINVTVIGLNKGGVTNAEGHFTIEQVPPGIYRLQATAIGYLDRDGREPDGARRHYCHCFPFSA